MRGRSIIDDRTFLDLISVSSPSGLVFRTQYASSNAWTRWAGNPGPYRALESTMSDCVSPEKLRPRPYNQVDHVKYVAAWLKGRKTVSFPSPTRNLIIEVDHPFMYRPAVNLSEGPWATMADELASLASGNTSHSVQLLVTLWELEKTIKMMRNPFALLKPNFRRTAKKLTASRLAKGTANVWLEGYYGWKSLYQDLTSTAQATAFLLNEPASDAFERLGQRLSVTHQSTTALNRTSYVLGTSESQWNTACNGGTWCTPYYPAQNYFVRVVGENAVSKYTYGCRQFLETERRISVMRSFLANYGASSWRAIRDCFWEVLPFSFVVDWFVDMRGIWAPLDRGRLGESDLNGFGFSKSTTGEYKIELYLDPYVAFSYYAGEWVYVLPRSQTPNTILSEYGHYKHYFRAPGDPPLVDVPSLMLGKGFSFIRGINGAALITQLFLNWKKK